MRIRAGGTSLSGWATFAWIGIPRRNGSCSTAPSALRDTWVKIRSAGKTRNGYSRNRWNPQRRRMRAPERRTNCRGDGREQNREGPDDSDALPEQAMAECLRIAGMTPEQVECVAIVRSVLGGARVNLHVRARFPNSRFVLVEHHAAHAASAYYPSGFDEATVLTLDRSGDFRCGARWHARPK